LHRFLRIITVLSPIVEFGHSDFRKITVADASKGYLAVHLKHSAHTEYTDIGVKQILLHRLSRRMKLTRVHNILNFKFCSRLHRLLGKKRDPFGDKVTYYFNTRAKIIFFFHFQAQKSLSTIRLKGFFYGIGCHNL